MEAVTLPPGSTPVAAGQRIEALDVVRGVALLGIFLMNIEWFTRPLQENGSGLDPSAQGVDRLAAWLVYVFVQGKFWVLFALLFGTGHAVMATRAGDQARFRRTWTRRCATLLVFGILHALLLWPGDILAIYAVAGFALLALGDPGQRLRLWAGVGVCLGLGVLTVLGGWLLSTMPGDAEGMAGFGSGLRAEGDAAAAVYASGSYAAVVQQRASDFVSLALQSSVTVVPMALSLFLLGGWLLRSGRLHDVSAHRAWFARLAGWTLPTGLFLAALSLAVGDRFDVVTQTGPMTVAAGLMLLASLPMALAYLALLVLGLCLPGTSRWLAWLAPAGRMALTHYLLQSLLASSLFYGYGLGLWGELGRAAQVVLVLAIFALQAVASHWWLARYRFGPMEWLWRWASYGTRPPMRVT